MDNQGRTDAVRFIDILTTASAVASYLGTTEVTADAMLQAIGILRGTAGLSDLGRPLSPLVPRPPTGPAVAGPVLEVVQRWWTALGQDPFAELDDGLLSQFESDLRAAL